MSDGGAQHITFGPFFDSAGALLPSIKVYHYAAGTTNSADMWSDENKVTPVAQPFVGDTGGIARLFGDNIYKIVIHDENDNLIEDYTWDNVHISRDVEGVVRNGTSFPSVIPNNTWQMAVKKDGSGNFSELGVSDGSSFIVLVKMNAAGDTHIFDNILASGAITVAEHALVSKSEDYTLLATDEIIHITTAGETPPGACTGALAGAGAGNVDDGTHSYKITFVDADGETEGGTTSNVVTVADKSTDGQISLTSIPTGSGSVTSRKIYRTIAGDTGNYKLVATLGDNVTTIYTDNTADAGLGADIPIVPPSKVTITVPSAIIAETGRRFILEKVDAASGAYTIATEDAETINGAASYDNWRQYERVVLESDGTNLFVDANRILDEDDMRSDSALHTVTQQSLKAYVDPHDHSRGVGATIGIDGVVQSSLKTAEGSVSTTSTTGQNLTLPGGQFGFFPQFKNSGGGNTTYWGHASSDYAAFVQGTSYVTAITLRVDAGTGFAQQTYMQASPPYKFGNKQWGHFLYMLVNAQGDVISSYEAEDPPYAYNGPFHNAKDSIERIMAVPHPFADYWNRDPAIDGLEIVLVDSREYDTKKWKADNAKQGRGILEDLGHINRKGKIVTPQELGIGNIQGFTDRVKIRKP